MTVSGWRRPRALIARQGGLLEKESSASGARSCAFQLLEVVAQLARGIMFNLTRCEREGATEMTLKQLESWMRVRLSSAKRFDVDELAAELLRKYRNDRAFANELLDA